MDNQEGDVAPQKRRARVPDFANVLDSFYNGIEDARGGFRRVASYTHRRVLFATNRYKYHTLQKFAPTERVDDGSVQHEASDSIAGVPGSHCRDMLCLHSSKLSFFDEFRIICGVPVFELVTRPQDPATGAGKGDVTEGTTSVVRTQDTETKASTPSPYMATCVSFSEDSSQLVSGHQDGAVRVWDAEHGRLLNCLTGQHDGKVSDVCFCHRRQSVVLSCDWSGSLVTWDFTTGRTETDDCGFRWSNFHIGSEPFPPQFSSMGGIVIFPIKTTLELQSFQSERDLSRSVLAMKTGKVLNVKGSAQNGGRAATGQLANGVGIVRQGGNSKSIAYVQAYVLFTCKTYPRSKLVKELVVPLLEESSSSCSLAPFFKLSADGKGLLAGFRGHSHSFLVLWTDFVDMVDMSYQLDAGGSNTGAWRKDGRMVVTWSLQADGGSSVEDSEYLPPGGICYVWHVTKFQGASKSYNIANAGHPKLVAPDPVRLQHQSGHRVAWCEFLELQEGWFVAQALLGKEMMVVLWDVEGKSPVSILGSGVQASLPVVSHQTSDVLARMVNLSVPKTMRGIAASPDSRWLGYFDANNNKGMVWDMAVGVQVLSLELPEGTCQTSSDNVGLLFSNHGKFVMFGGALREMLLWLPRNFGPRSKASVQLVDLETTDQSMHSLDTRRHPTSCSFSNDGRLVGLVHAYTPAMSVWDLERGIKHTLKLPSNAEINSLGFCDFAMSPYGHCIATCMSDNSVLLWVYRPDSSQVGYTMDGKLTDLKAAFYPKRAICFSCDLAGQETVVICEDDGTLVWVGVSDKVELERTSSKVAYNFHCTFSQNGKRAVQMQDPQTALVWDLVGRRVLNTVQFNLRLGLTGEFPFPLNIHPEGVSAVVGTLRDGPGMQVLTWDTTEDILRENVEGIPNHITISDSGRWALTDDSSGLPHPEASDWRSFSSVGTMPRRAATVGALWVRDVTGKSEPKKLAVPDLDPSMFMAMSEHGDKVACLTKDKRLIVWTPYAADGCIPDYNMVQAGRRGGQGAVGDGVEELLAKHGVSLLNYPDESGMNILFQAIYNNDIGLVRRLLNWVCQKKMKISMRTDTTADSADWKRVPNALQLALQRRSPETARVLVEYLLGGVTTEAAQAQIFKESLLNVLRVYPSLFYDVMSDKRVFLKIGEHMAPERAFEHRELLATSCEMMLPSEKSLKEMWDTKVREKYDSYQLAMSVNIETVAKVIPYPDIARIGKKGLLRALVANRTTHQMYAATPIASLVDYKWHSYGRELLLEELTHYALLLASFTAYCIFLGHLGEFEERSASFNDAVAIFAAISLVVSIILAFFNLVRKIFQVITLVKEEGLRGFVMWSNFHWHSIEIASYLIVVFLIPFAFVKGEARQDVDLSSLSAIVVIMLWWKALYYCGPFRSTGSLVVMIREILKDIMIFMLLAFSVLFGFGIAFYVLYRHARSAHTGRRAACSLFNETEVQGMKTVDPEMTMFLAPEVRESLMRCAEAVRPKDRVPEVRQQNELDDEEERDVLNAFGTLSRTLLTMFGFLLGDFDLETLWEAESASVAVTLFVLYALAMMIVLLNLLIAIMGDSFDKVKNTQESTFVKARALVIHDVETMMSERKKREKEERIMKYLHILVPKHRSEKVKGSRWKGRVMEIESRVKRVFDASFRNSKAAISSIEANQKILMEHLMNQRGGEGHSAAALPPLPRHPASGSTPRRTLRRGPSGYVPIDEVIHE